VFSLESDILIRRIPVNRIWILKNGFGDEFGTEIILSIYFPSREPWKVTHTDEGICSQICTDRARTQKYGKATTAFVGFTAHHGMMGYQLGPARPKSGPTSLDLFETLAAQIRPYVNVGD
jgi:hypothetical protein